jgi:YecR-like lipoprotein
MPAVVMLAACTAQRSDQGQVIVTVSYRYGESDESTRQWRALLNALDQCHLKGYKDAQPVSPPETICEKAGESSCLRFRATVSYDCFGMGYQTSS